MSTVFAQIAQKKRRDNVAALAGLIMIAAAFAVLVGVGIGVGVLWGWFGVGAYVVVLGLALIAVTVLGYRAFLVSEEKRRKEAANA